MDQEKIGKFISIKRNEKKLTQQELADKLGVTDKAISKWENGRCLPDVSLMIPLCDALDISLNELFKGDSINDVKVESDNNLEKILKEYYRMKKIKNFLLALILVIIAWFIQGGLILGLLLFSYESANVEVIDDISKYNEVIGKEAVDVYQNKWGMSEEIFPSEIKDMNILDFKMVYYNPWDAQYLSYLVVEYDDIQSEIDRLNSIESTEYLGYYGVIGFYGKYELIAMNADKYQGFVYALREVGTNKIIYVEIIFCNYFMDLDYKKYINEEYLPVGFDATVDNKYRYKMLNE